MVGTIWKNIEKWFRNWCQKSHTILLKVIYLENKQCEFFQTLSFLGLEFFENVEKTSLSYLQNEDFSSEDSVPLKLKE